MSKDAVNSIELIEVTELNSPEYNAAIELYCKLFPSEEQKPLDQIRSMIEKKVYTLYVARHNLFTKIIGFAFVMFNKNPEFLFIDNIAIDEKLQGQGFGSQLFEKLAERQKDSSLGVFLEIELPELAADEQDLKVREKRIDFYKRLGCIPMPEIAYKFPHKEEPIPLLLMFRPSPRVKTLTPDTIKNMILSIYDNIHYDVDNRHDILASYEHTITEQKF